MPTLAMKFGKGKGKAKDERRDGYSPIPDPEESGSFPHESHELVAQDATASGAQPGPSGQSKSRRLREAEKRREQAHKKDEERKELQGQTQKARKSGDSSLAKRLVKRAKKCWHAVKRLHQRASDLFYKGRSWRVGPRAAEHIRLVFQSGIGYGDSSWLSGLHGLSA
jgi:hypothetical protein